MIIDIKLAEKFAKIDTQFLWVQNVVENHKKTIKEGLSDKYIDTDVVKNILLDGMIAKTLEGNDDIKESVENVLKIRMLEIKYKNLMVKLHEDKEFRYSMMKTDGKKVEF